VRDDYIYLDGSNIATERRDGALVANLDALLECSESLQQAFPDSKIVVCVDSTFRHRVPEVNKARCAKLITDGVIRDLASGIAGGADKVILEAANKAHGIVVSNDHFREWAASYPFIRISGRHLSARKAPGAGWLFLEMKPR
jgi:hypothetical protein